MVDWESFKDGILEEHEGVACYTDGSQVELHDGSLSDVGFGFLIKHTHGNITKLWGNIGKAIVFQGEVFAIHKAAEMLLEYEPEPVHFFVDCQAAIIDVCAIECSSYTVKDCKEALSKLCQTRPVIFHWVQAHVGHELNEEADRLAKQGTTSQWTYKVPLAWCQVKQTLKQESKTIWGRRWENEKTSRQTRLALPTLYPPWPNTYSLYQD